ncbi:unnamed protein product [Ceutorhynchus assimilis]|uniref:Bromodomain associated domain-containing protein n=1 Tax=Ceutorhynchus assimilis TaxID=467358 RepID=A0A9N9MZY8_9CUCU|nr:unnamed protein product [Ceutorhynchus assimilis]
MAEALPEMPESAEALSESEFSSDSEEEPEVPEDIVPPNERYKYFRWGSIPEENSSEYEYVLPDVSEDIKQSMQADCLDKYPDEADVVQIIETTLPPLDPLIMYSIQLHKWMKNMTETIHLTEIANEGNLVMAEDAKVPIPEMPEVKFMSHQHQWSFMPRLPLKVARIELDIPELSDAMVKQMLPKSIAVMLAHIGFEETNKSILDILVDVLEQFLLKISNRFVEALNEEESLGTTGFPNIIERVLVEIGFGGCKGLQDYYQTRVIKYMKVLQNRCQELDNHYSSLVLKKSDSPVGEFGTWFNIKVKKEDRKEGEEGGYGESDLITTEYQLLSNLECTDMFMMDTVPELPYSH